MDWQGKAIFRQRGDGLRALFSVDTQEVQDMGYGEYRHISISRENKYPGWDEMRDFIYSCGLFDKTKDVIMFLPPKKEYVNLHSNTFHFYQKI